MEEVSMLQPHIRNTMEQIAKFVFVPSNEHEYNQLVALLDEVTDIVRDDETHPLVNMMDVLGVLIENYEAQTVSEPAPILSRS
jgi:HTH-type transcriptional regulator/antitoxin HigA